MAETQLEILIKARNQAKAEFDKLNKQVKDLQGKNGFGGLDEKVKSFGNSFKNVTGISLGFATAATVAMTAVKFLWNELKKAESAANESAIADAKLNAVLESTRGVAGMTAKQLDAIATATSKLTGIDDELIKSSEAVLLTFTQIGQQVFPETMQAAIDMSAVLGQDLQSSVTMIGKAMNDFTGYSALRRAGVSFTSTQIAQIEKFKQTNDLIGYQSLLLKELQTEYGGAAKKINEASDQLSNLKVAQENYYEAVGESLVPIRRSWNQFWIDWYEGATMLVDKSNEGRREFNAYKETLDQLGVSYNTAYSNGQQYLTGFVQNNLDLTKDQVDALVSQKNAQDAVSGATQVMGRHLEEVNGVLTITNATMVDIASATKEEAGNVNDVTQYFKALNAELLFNKIAASLSAEAQLELAFQMGLVDQQTYNTFTAIDALTTKYDLNADGVISLTEKTAEYDLAVKALVQTIQNADGTTANMRVNVIQNGQANLNYGGYVSSTPSAAALSSPMVKTTVIPQASGGDWLVNKPTLFMAGEAGLERATFTPGGGASNGVTVVVNYSPAISLSDKTEVQTKLLPLILEAVKRVK